MEHLVEKHRLIERWNHWVNFPVLAVMVWSGLMIYWANDIYRIGLGRHTLLAMKLPDAAYDALHLSHALAAGMAWHFAFAWLLVINGVGYVLFSLITGHWHELAPNRHSLSDACDVILHDLGIRKSPNRPSGYNGAQRIAYTAIVLMGLASVATGLAIYKPVQFGALAAFFGGYTTARFIHFWLTIGYLAFFVIHIAQVARAGWSNFRAMVTGYDIEEAGHERG